MSGYVTRLEHEIRAAEALATKIGAELDRTVDSIYVGGGTPTTLDASHLEQIFATLHDEFDVVKGAEVMVECAPGTLRPEILEALLKVGTNRVSLGTQSFVDLEIRSVGRLHTAEQARVDIARLRETGITNINLDLIAGLPHQTSESWRLSLEEVAQLQTPHASVYILEVDEDSRLGRELIAGGSRYHAHQVPDSDLAADLYLEGTEFLDSAGLAQYEISNFSVPGKESRHNLKYWTRQPYVGFGLDAHSMLSVHKGMSGEESVRFSNTDALDTYIAGSTPTVERVDRQQAIEESMFLGLRLNSGVDLSHIDTQTLDGLKTELQELTALGLLETHRNSLRLTARGRLLSNEVFARFVDVERIA